ncbi:MAG: hypothetical protein ACK55Z_12990 [bacterium]
MSHRLPLTFGKFPELFGRKDARGGDDVIADDAVVRVVRVPCTAHAHIFKGTISRDFDFSCL